MRIEKSISAEIITLLIVWIVVQVRASTITEDFAGNPVAKGWQIFGDPDLFHWDSTNENLRVTWDSSKTNSFFHLPLVNILSRDDDFELSFDLTFDDYASGTTSNKPFAAAAAIGFLDLDQATLTNFSRGAGVNATYGPRNLFEFDFFPPFASFMPTIAQTIVSTNNAWLYNHDNLADMTPGTTFRLAMTYDGAARTLLTTVTNNSGQCGDTQTIIVPANFDFRVATFSISSYSDMHDIGSILAHGTVDNITITTPPPPVENLSGAFNGDVRQAQFTSRSNWVYSLERTTNLDLWAAATGSMTGNGGMLILQDTNPPTGATYYRVKAQKP